MKVNKETAQTYFELYNMLLPLTVAWGNCEAVAGIRIRLYLAVG